MKININEVAKLANLPLTDEEKNKFEKQLNETLDYIDQLNEINTENVEPTYQVTGLENVLREDIAADSLSQNDALLNTTNKDDGYFKVRGILDNQ